LFITPFTPISKVNASDNSSSNQSSPDVKQKAAQIAKEQKKNRITIGSPDGAYHYDSIGATHKGVETPHLQRSYWRVNPYTGERFLNKDRKYVRRLTKQDIRLIMNFINRLKK
jgi:hypothetical protein